MKIVIHVLLLVSTGFVFGERDTHLPGLHRRVAPSRNLLIDTKTIERLVEDLGSENFPIRDNGKRKLLEYTPSPDLYYLVESLNKNTTLEHSRRIQWHLDQIREHIRVSPRVIYNSIVQDQLNSKAAQFAVDLMDSIRSQFTEKDKAHIRNLAKRVRILDLEIDTFRRKGAQQKAQVLITARDTLSKEIFDIFEKQLLDKRNDTSFTLNAVQNRSYVRSFVVEKDGAVSSFEVNYYGELWLLFGFDGMPRPKQLQFDLRPLARYQRHESIAPFTNRNTVLSLAVAEIIADDLDSTLYTVSFRDSDEPMPFFRQIPRIIARSFFRDNNVEVLHYDDTLEFDRPRSRLP